MTNTHKEQAIQYLKDYNNFNSNLFDSEENLNIILSNAIDIALQAQQKQHEADIQNIKDSFNVYYKNKIRVLEERIKETR